MGVYFLKKTKKCTDKSVFNSEASECIELLLEKWLKKAHMERWAAKRVWNIGYFLHLNIMTEGDQAFNTWCPGDTETMSKLQNMWINKSNGI